MKKQINDLLLKMQTGENCIGETANKLLDLYSVSHRRELLVCSRCSLENDSDSDICYNCLEEIQALT